MNAVEIEEAVSALANKVFDAQEFAFEFLRAFGNKETTIKRLRTGQSNASDLDNGVLQRNYIHIAVCDEDSVTDTLRVLKDSKATEKAKAKFVLATDGFNIQAEDLTSGETISSNLPDLADHFGFFLPLAGISTTREIKDNPIDIRATGRLNKLYIELLKDNPEWATEERRQDMNHFMARLIFCFFSEDTEIFLPNGIFTQTIEEMSERDSSNTHEVISTLFSVMNIDYSERDIKRTPVWAKKFPYVNGGLFSGNTDAPKFSKIARTYLLHAGALNWQKINPDIFGSMIQAVTNEDERDFLGMHYTSMPNILKVLNPLFCDDLREQLELSKDSPLKLLNLRKRIAHIRVFDPACGSGNFLVIAYKEFRKLEAEINELRNEKGRATDIPLTNFRGIEINSFPAEIARLALIIAEYQSNVQYCGQREALQTVLPLSKENWIVCGNALRLDWLSICPPTGNVVKSFSDDLFSMQLDHQSEFNFENEGGEIYICANPPYKGSKKRDKKLTEDLGYVLAPLQKVWKDNDYVAGWFVKAADFIQKTYAKAGLVTTNSINQGKQVELLWPLIDQFGVEISWAYRSFKWSNLAQKNATVMVSIIGLQRKSNTVKKIIDGDFTKRVNRISPYLIDSEIMSIKSSRKNLSNLDLMKYGNMPYGKGLLINSTEEKNAIINASPNANNLIRPFAGGYEFLHAKARYCLWIDDEQLTEAIKNPLIKKRIDDVRSQREASTDSGGQKLAKKAHQFRERYVSQQHSIVIPRTSSENRDYLPVGILPSNWILSSETFVMFDASIYYIALLTSKLHLVWLATTCGKMKDDYRYSNTLGWNTFPVPRLTEKNKLDLACCAENIVLARESHFPATIADLYDREGMPENLRIAHEKNDEVLERIYIGRRFKNDTERLEKLFSMYTDMTSKQAGKKKQ